MSEEDIQPAPLDVTMDAIGNSLAHICDTIATSMQLVVKAIVPAWQSISDAVWEQYRAEGMCYGETHEGMMRWLEDRYKINQHLQEIEYIQQRQQIQIDARLLGEKIRAKREANEQ